MNSTYATVIITDANKAQAQSDMGDGFFNTPLSSTGELPATNWMSSGWFLNNELDFIVNDATWAKQVFFGNDFQSVLTELGLLIVNVPEVVDEGEV